MPGVPPALAGRMTLGVRFLWTGAADEGRELLDQIRSVAPVILDDADLKPYLAVDSVHADPVDPMPVVDPAMLLTEFTDVTAKRLLDVAGYESGSPQIMVEVRQLGGAYAREAEHPNAFSHRAAGFSVLAVGIARRPPRATALGPPLRGAVRVGHRRRLAELRASPRRPDGAPRVRRGDTSADRRGEPKVRPGRCPADR